MSRTPLFQILKNAFVKARLLEHKAISSDQIEEQEYRLRIPRRKFLTGTAAVISTSVLTPKIIQASSAVQPTVAIIGAGLTGLHCAYRLFKAGIRSTIFEASGRIGGRIQTARGAFPSDQVIELGGEFLDTGHKNLYALLRELGVQTYDIFASDTTESNLSYIDGRKISKAEMADAFRPIVRQVAAVLKKAKADPSTLRQIDRMNIREWLETMPDISPMVKKSTFSWCCAISRSSRSGSPIGSSLRSKVP